MTPQFKAGDEVIFKREKLSKEWLIEFGTSAVYLTYTVKVQIRDKVFINGPIGLSFDVDADSIELVPDDFEQANAITPFVGVINELERIK